MSALFELIAPTIRETMEPAAGLATHYVIRSARHAANVFPARASESARGIKPCRTDSLKRSIQRSRRACPAGIRPSGADGALITANDCCLLVAATTWIRRLAAPVCLRPVLCAQAAESLQHVGTRQPEHLGVRALDDFTFEVELDAAEPASFSN